MKRWWRGVVREFELEPHQVHLLRLAAESYDRAQSCRGVLDKHGETFPDRFGQPRLRPEATVERDARRDFGRLVAQLNFPDADSETPR